MSDHLSDLYQEIILSHNKRPRNYREMDSPTHVSHGNNPLCGDELTIYLHVNEETTTIEDISFQGQGCAISRASASLMTAQLKGKTLEEFQTEFDQIKEMLSSEQEIHVDLAQLGEMAALAGVRQFPARIKCATLSWHTVKAALEGKKAISTE